MQQKALLHGYINCAGTWTALAKKTQKSCDEGSKAI